MNVEELKSLENGRKRMIGTNYFPNPELQALKP